MGQGLAWCLTSMLFHAMFEHVCFFLGRWSSQFLAIVARGENHIQTGSLKMMLRAISNQQWSHKVPKKRRQKIWVKYTSLSYSSAILLLYHLFFHRWQWANHHHPPIHLVNTDGPRAIRSLISVNFPRHDDTKEGNSPPWEFMEYLNHQWWSLQLCCFVFTKNDTSIIHEYIWNTTFDDTLW